MAKEEALAELANAKKAHAAWVSRANALIEGYPFDKEAVPAAHTECRFGIWFYGEGQKLDRLTGMDGLKEVETLHNELHECYRSIYELYAGHQQPFFSKLLGYPKKIAPEHQVFAREQYRTLKGISEKLAHHIDRIERRLSALPEKHFS